MAQNKFFQDLCRICTSQTNGISIYSKEGKEISLEEKIKKFLSIQVNEEDKLPKMVCSLCQNKLESIHKFATMAVDSQSKLLEYLNPQNISLDADGHNYISCQLSTLVEESDATKEEQSNSYDSSSDKDVKISLLHTILTQGQVSSISDDVTEMEVTVDPMLFFEEEGEELIKGDGSSSVSNISFEQEYHSPQIYEAKPYQCTLCPRGFNSDLSLKNHLWNHLPSKKILVTSDLNRYQSQSSLTSGSFRHRRLYNSQCLCQECGRIYPTRSTLRAHQITHSNLRPHKCSLCDKTFKRNQDLKFHLNQHTGERPYRCPYCPKAFASSGNCFSHRKRMHSKQLARDKKISRH